MDRDAFYKLMAGEGTFDYEVYLRTPELLRLQKPYHQLCNRDELMFQLVHQVCELWMKLAAYSLLEADEEIQAGRFTRALTCLERVHRAQHLLMDSIAVLETMSPKDYQTIRLQLGNGSGQESPGFRALLRMPPHLWNSFSGALAAQGLTVESLYGERYDHGPLYLLAEALCEFDELFQKWRFHHVQLIHRSIGLGAKSLKGRSVDLLNEGLRTKFFPELWRVRVAMTDAWGQSYGTVRESIAGKVE